MLGAVVPWQMYLFWLRTLGFVLQSVVVCCFDTYDLVVYGQMAVPSLPVEEDIFASPLNIPRNQQGFWTLVVHGWNSVLCEHQKITSAILGHSSLAL